MAARTGDATVFFPVNEAAVVAVAPCGHGTSAWRTGQLNRPYYSGHAPMHLPALHIGVHSLDDLLAKGANSNVEGSRGRTQRSSRHKNSPELEGSDKADWGACFGSPIDPRQPGLFDLGRSPTTSPETVDKHSRWG